MFGPVFQIWILTSCFVPCESNTPICVSVHAFSLIGQRAIIGIVKSPWNTGDDAFRLPASTVSDVGLAETFWPNGSLMSRMPSCSTPFSYMRPCTMKPLAGDTIWPSASTWKLPARV